MLGVRRRYSGAINKTKNIPPDIFYFLIKKFLPPLGLSFLVFQKKKKKKKMCGPRYECSRL
jgi:hypothetical protein